MLPGLNEETQKIRIQSCPSTPGTAHLKAEFLGHSNPPRSGSRDVHPGGQGHFLEELRKAHWTILLRHLYRKGPFRHGVKLSVVLERPSQCAETEKQLRKVNKKENLRLPAREKKRGKTSWNACSMKKKQIAQGAVFETFFVFANFMVRNSFPRQWLHISRGPKNTECTPFVFKTVCYLPQRRLHRWLATT